VQFKDNALVLLDQRALPQKTEWVTCTTWPEVRDAIRQMVVRGAPAIGVAAAFGMALAAWAGAGPDSARRDLNAADLEAAARGLKGARPTAVNLSWAVGRMHARARQTGADYGALVAEARAIAEEDLTMCRAIGAAGAALIPTGACVMTHCNAGALATAGYGTALGVVRAAFETGKGIRVIACETRPLLQGARLTAWELRQDGIPVTLITDSMAAHVMKAGMVHAVIVGADRIARNGDVANKIGTYGLSVLARHHGIPFYVAAPASTVDVATPAGEAIVIEERDPDEVRIVAGTPVAPRDVDVLNPAFDVTPHQNVTAFVLDAGIIYPPFESSLCAIAREAHDRPRPAAEAETFAQGGKRDA